VIRRRTHMKVDIKGALMRSERELSAMFTNDGRPMSGKQVKRELMDLLQKGYSVMPVCDQEECPDFDWFGGGCPGHPMQETGEVTE